METIEDQLINLKTEYQNFREKWFHGETIDPVFEGVVRDFCAFDETMNNVHNKVGIFMKSVDSLATGLTALTEGVTENMARANDSQIASDSCKMKEATNQIARADAPHSAIAKLRRDMEFNILSPVQNHIANNRNLKVSLDIRRRRLIELNSAKKVLEDCQKRNLSQTDRRYLQAQSNFEAAKLSFSDVDRHVFEWLYILEEYRGDILDSTLQTLKYLEYEFFASSAHAISSSLPSRMEFRPMVEMTPEHLEAQVEMELQESEEGGACADATGEAFSNQAPIADFSMRLIDKRAKDEPSEGPSLPVDPLSLSSLLSQGFEEGPARRALRLHQNDTQAALDWLIDGHHEESNKQKQMSEGVRMPTTVKRVHKLKAMRKAQQEKQKEKQRKEEEERRRDEEQKETGRGDTEAEDRNGRAKGWPTSPAEGSKPSDSRDAGDKESPAASKRKPPPPVEDMLNLSDEGPKQPKGATAAGTDLLSLDTAEAPAAVTSVAAASTDLLGTDDASAEAPALPTDFSRALELSELPVQFAFDPTRCEKPPLPAAVAAGLAQPRSVSGDAGLLGGLFAASPEAESSSAAMAPSEMNVEIQPTVAAPTLPKAGGLDSLDPFGGLS